MKLHHKSWLSGAYLITTVALFASPVCANPQDYDIEQDTGQPPATGKISVKIKNLTNNTDVKGAVIHGDASVGPRSLGTPTMTLHMIALPTSTPGQYTFKIEPGMQVFDVTVAADIPGETATVAKKLQVNDQGGNGQGQNGQGQNGQGQNGQGQNGQGQNGQGQNGQGQNGQGQNGQGQNGQGQNGQGQNGQ